MGGKTYQEMSIMYVFRLQVKGEISANTSELSLPKRNFSKDSAGNYHLGEGKER